MIYRRCLVSNTTSFMRPLTDPWRAQRMISMSLIYDGETVKSRLVDGFMLCEDSDLFFASSEDWQPYSEALSFASGHHK